MIEQGLAAQGIGQPQQGNGMSQQELMELIQQVAQLLQQGISPEQLVQQGVPEEIIQAALQMVESNQPRTEQPQGLASTGLM